MFVFDSQAAYGVVYSAKFGERQQNVVVKEMTKYYATKEQRIHKQLTSLEDQYLHVGKSSIRRVVRLLVVYEYEQTIWLVLESSGQDLSKFKNLADKVVADYLRQIMVALRFIHGNGIIHYDIKPGNIMLNSRNIIQITDFGCAEYCAPEQMLSFGLKTRGSETYMAPEVAGFRPSNHIADIYSTGVAALELSRNAQFG